MLLLGIRSIEQLATQDPMDLYERLCVLQKTRVDPCMIDVFMAVVEHSQTGIVKDWWEYTPRRKQLLAAMTAPADTPRTTSRPRKKAAPRTKK
ncbi:MAG: mitomycin resistance protein [Planctomycetota bacterium]|nr:mitomycin resistance protein [Planctomycetota bacterium]